MTLLATLLACSDYNVVPKPVDVDPGEVTECGFTRVGDTSFYAYDCNPVFTSTDEDWLKDVGSTTFSVTEVLGHPFYQLWYVGVGNDGNYTGMGYAVSAEGTNWTPWEGNPGITNEDQQGFDKTTMQGNQVVYDPSTGKYVMVYSGLDLSTADGGGGLGVATSANGRTWERIEQNPVIELDQTVPGVTNWCWFLGMDLGTVAGFQGYIAGSTKGQACAAWPVSGSSITDWQIDPEPALEAGERDDWDDMGFISMNEASLGKKDYMFYVGFGEWIDHDYYISASNAFLGWAEKSEGNWVRKDIIPINQTEVGEVSAVAAVTVGSRIHLWVTDNWDGHSGVGYFLFDPDKAAAEDGG